MRSWNIVCVMTSLLAWSAVSVGEDATTVAVIGTGDLWNSLGLKLAGIGYRIGCPAQSRHR